MSKKPAYSVFKAIADPTRREILILLVTASSTAMSINGIAENFGSSRQAITKHLNILQSAGLVRIDQQGRERYCSPEIEPLKEVTEWLAAYEKFWNRKLDDLEGFLDATSPNT